MNTLQQVRFIWKPAVFVACLLPFTLVVGDLFEITGQLGANPIEEIMDRFGNWSLRFILLTLAVTPVRRISGWNWLARFRRMFGLFTFFYVLMHFLTWLVLDQGLLLSAILEDIIGLDRMGDKLAENIIDGITEAIMIRGGRVVARHPDGTLVWASDPIGVGWRAE